MIHHDQHIDLYTTMSILGYCLLPFDMLAGAAFAFDLNHPIGYALCGAVIVWSTLMATKFIDIILNMRGKRALIAYPIALFYMCFLLLAVF